ncbi:MAG: hypothetical protein B6A08_13625 [Sorangiineae bacterium NIC37A_2]|nr:MAG: hypothetical protein B6A08_13625 [Sorangiineae bacterium NIC37A_2]
MHRHLRLFVLSSLSTALSVYACGSPSKRGVDSDGEVPSIETACAEFSEPAGWHRGESVSPAAEASMDRVAAVGEATWPLALDLLKSVSVESHPNIAQSPTSLFAALGMAYSQWQNGQCGERIATVLRFPETGDAIHPAIGAGLLHLAERARPATDDSSAVALNLSSSRWAMGQSSIPKITEIHRIYGATPHAVEDQGEASRQLINCVIEQQSSGLLKDFIPEGVIGAETVSLDINVTYLKAPWPRAFEEAEVYFTPEGGQRARVPGLHSGALSASYYEAPSFHALHLPLRGGELKVLLVVPRETFTASLEEFVASLPDNELRAARDTTLMDTFDFRMPKIDITAEPMNYTGRLGFDCDPFTLGDLIHGAGVVMDEGGLEAVAATVAEEWGDGGFEPTTRPFAIERPFLFFVFDTATRFVLFSGRVLDAG